MINIMVCEMTFAMKILCCFTLAIIMRNIMACEIMFALKILHCLYWELLL